MRSVNLEILWNKWDKLRTYEKALVEVYSSVRRVIDVEAAAVKTLLAAYKHQQELSTKLANELKLKPHFRMVADSLEILKDISKHKANKIKEEHEMLLEKVLTPLANRLVVNEENLAMIAQGEKNYHAFMELQKQVSEKFNKMYYAGQQYDFIFEDELIKQQLKYPGFKMTPKTASTKSAKAYEKLKEEEKQYKFAVENYNRHTSSFMNQNVDCLHPREKLLTRWSLISLPLGSFTKELWRDQSRLPRHFIHQMPTWT